ncbi:MAG TPA: TIGR01841 family phasin [Albitalea sp.]|nr:TIGR01841 family phasin [Albitalea sp.]
MLNTEQFAATQKANLEAVLGLSAKAFEGVEQLTALNLQVAKASLGEATDAGLAALSVKDPQALLALQAGALQPLADKAAAYSRQVYDILSTTKAEFDKVSAESVAEAQSVLASAFDSLAKSAPAGSENGIALWKSAIATASGAYESMQKAVQQATDVAEANVAAATAVAAKPARAKRAA